LTLKTAAAVSVDPHSSGGGGVGRLLRRGTRKHGARSGKGVEVSLRAAVRAVHRAAGASVVTGACAHAKVSTVCRSGWKEMHMRHTPPSRGRRCRRERSLQRFRSS
jgi:hypothetical protein